MSVALPKLTWEDYLAIPPDGKRHELIDGEHYVSPAPNVRHQRLVRELAFALNALVRRAGLGEIFFAPFDVKLTEVDVLQPDLVFISRERAGLLTESHLAGAPDLAVEVLSASTRRVDEMLKRRLYERVGVAEYWVVDPELETVKVYRQGANGFDRALELAVERGERLESPLLPGLSLPLVDLFAGA
ncbi:MAG TPA: Uma2 family endonuclease [Thermoanaerobaculia bacterium]|nr:Uma2 family endonuclease [Thermoanaerobaculia bacterium]